MVSMPLSILLNSLYLSSRFSNGVMSSSHILNLISNGLEITLDATGSFIDKKSSFSMAYLVSHRNLDILHLHLDSNKVKITPSLLLPFVQSNLRSSISEF